jgi:transposase
MAYEKRFKARVLVYLAQGHSQQKTAALFGIGTTTLKEWKKRTDTGEGLDARIRKRNPKKIVPAHLLAFLAQKPDACLEEIAARFACWPSAVTKALRKLDITREKRPRRLSSVTSMPARSSAKPSRACPPNASRSLMKQG